MKRISNDKLIRRNARIGQVLSIGALVILGVGMYITFQIPEYFFYSLIALVLGFFLSQIGMYFGNRWGRSPRPDELIDRGLKGLGREYTIYHYILPTSHLLVAPTGIWVLLPYLQRGKITYEKKRWRLRGGGFIQGYLRFFGQEGLGRPDAQARVEIGSTHRYLNRLIPETEIPAIEAAALFLHPEAELDVADAPIPALTAKDFKELLKKRGKNIIPETTLSAIRQALPMESKD